MFNFMVGSVLMVLALYFAADGDTTRAVIAGSIGMLNLWCAVYRKRKWGYLTDSRNNYLTVSH